MSSSDSALDQPLPADLTVGADLTAVVAASVVDLAASVAVAELAVLGAEPAVDLAAVEPPVDPTPVVLKGTGRGLEIQIDGAATLEGICDRLTELLGEAPGFFAGNQARIVVDGQLPAGALGRLEEVATRFSLTIVEIGPLRPLRADGNRTLTEVFDGVPQPNLAQGSAPLEDDAELVDPDDEREARAGATAAEASPETAVRMFEVEPGPRVVLGPVRSGVILEHPGHLVVIGDVNPGAEVRAEGNIMVLGRLRGVAHAAVGRDAGFILALRLEPQQLRVGRLVARAGDADSAGQGAELAYVTDKTIVVERYQGRLPGGLAASV